MSKKNFKIIISIFVFLIFSVLSFSENIEKTRFLSVGSLKIVKPETLVIKREDLNITIEKDRKIKVESLYTFQNTGDVNVKSTFMFWLDQSTVNDKSQKYIENIKFVSDFKKNKNSRAVINFSENIYDNQSSDNIQREWFAVTHTIEPQKTGRLTVNYNLVNTEFQINKKINFSFDLVNNFIDKNKTEILYINVYNKSGIKINSIIYKNYVFKNVSENSQKEHYELLEGNVALDGKMTINFK
ncbi:hypothetical protein [Pseudoleptotrichia goodfellowii]|uniref:Uncharacterized protein n=1 Tax=Pseudoleptotrichia goodfellowii F0264 TaxID=596323 RepID=D0GKN6_9FUSO|nr:hypothetical protein [Pseudoleptotrichia goodfellowii]EEY35327.1 hypothetical protein HMPREF0554_1478 [Pseudoleptotrichia goodfellowii F0264]MBF4805706.1 hypothetical protein [Pseudoleptotrichia goodfellowii]